MTKSENSLEFAFSVDFPKFRLNVAERIPLDGIVGLVGESGAGKSTMLRIIAGIERSAIGNVRFRDRVWMDTDANIFVPASRRALGIVFQEGRLFSHLDVTGNLSYGFKRKRGRTGPSWNEVCAALDLDPLLSRKVQTLSGGEQQRVALGRALLSGPELLLLDEPLASLDSNSKREIIPYLRRVISTFRLPGIYISHSREELRNLVSRVITVSGGAIVEGNGDRAATGQRQFLDAEIIRGLDGDLAVCRIGKNEIAVRLYGEPQACRRVRIAVINADLFVAESGQCSEFSAGSIPGVIKSAETRGEELAMDISTEAGRIAVEVHASACKARSTLIGRKVEIVFIRPPDAVF